MLQALLRKLHAGPLPGPLLARLAHPQGTPRAPRTPRASSPPRAFPPQRFLHDDDDMIKMCLTRKKELEELYQRLAEEAEAAAAAAAAVRPGGGRAGGRAGRHWAACWALRAVLALCVGALWGVGVNSKFRGVCCTAASG